MYEDLFAQARMLAKVDARKPRQANLRRAVSAAYYGTFHFPIDAACRTQLGSLASQAGYRHVLGRAFVHGTMKLACNSFRAGTLKQYVVKGLPLTNGVYVVPRQVRNIAATFYELQEKRHLADYDRTEYFNRVEVIATIDQAQTHVQEFEAFPLCDDRAFFLACLWAYKELANR
jgi:uncharacterized protein (UPF0332 family)